jgi:drug/metabolite transporter (DMT)-like permease
VYGAGDFLGGLASRRTSTLAVVVWSQAAGFLVLAVALPLVPGTPHAADLAWGGLCGVIGAAAVGLLYRGLAIGAMGVVSPITAVLAAMLPVLYGALHRAPISLTASIGIGISLAALIAISAAPPSSHAQARRGIGEAFGAGVMFGFFFIVLAQTRADAGLYPLLGARTASFVVFAVACTLLRVPYRPARAAIGIIVAGGVCDMLANVLYVIAAHAGSLAIVAVLTSLYPASTVALAAIFLRERLRALQWSGVALALAGVALISAGR